MLSVQQRSQGRANAQPCRYPEETRLRIAEERKANRADRMHTAADLPQSRSGKANIDAPEDQFRKCSKLNGPSMALALHSCLVASLGGSFVAVRHVSAMNWRGVACNSRRFGAEAPAPRAGTPAPQCGTGVPARQIAENVLENVQTP